MTLAGRPLLRILGIVAIGIAASALTWHQSRPAETLAVQPLSVSTAAPEMLKEKVSFRPGDTLEALLERSGVDPQLRQEMIVAVQEEFDVRKFRAGSHLTFLRSSRGVLESLEYVLDPDHKLQLEKSGESFRAQIEPIPGAIRQQRVCGTMQGSLVESVMRAGERPELALRIAEIFAWDLDFYRDPREGDEFCLLVEKKEYADGAPATYQRVLAAKYENEGTVYDAYFFESEDGDNHYYSSDGESLQAAFLRSPLEFSARVSSHFSTRRRHPVLGAYRAHLGTDYAAPTGTPVLAVADGRVTFSGRSGGSGNLITLQHANGFDTQYLHLSRMLVRAGDRVKQGERIGLVGATGLATGPHVDIRVRKNGRYLNWEKLDLPRESRIAAAQQNSFNAARDRFAASLASGPVAGTDTAGNDTPADGGSRIAASRKSDETTP